MSRKTLSEILKERDEVLLSLDEGRIRAYFKEYNGHDLSGDPNFFWCVVHKAITGDLNLPLAFRKKSKDWLAEHGFQSMDDGDL